MSDSINHLISSSKATKRTSRTQRTNMEQKKAKQSGCDQPITSKLGIIAERMDQFVRRENTMQNTIINQFEAKLAAAEIEIDNLGSAVDHLNGELAWERSQYHDYMNAMRRQLDQKNKSLRLYAKAIDCINLRGGRTYLNMLTDEGLPMAPVEMIDNRLVAINRENDVEWEDEDSGNEGGSENTDPDAPDVWLDDDAQV